MSVIAAYSRYSDNLALTADTLALDGGTLEAGYTLEYLRDVNAARPARLSTLQGMFKYHWAAPVAVNVIALLHANYVAGSVVHVQGNNTDVWTGPTFDQTITVPTWRVDRFPGQPYLVLTNLPNFGSFSYWRVGNLVNNTVNVSVGDIWLGSTFRLLDPNFVWGRTIGYDQPQIEHQTAYRRMRTPLSTTRRHVTGDIKSATDASAQDIFDTFLDANGRPILLIPDTSVAESMLALNTVSLQQMQQEFTNFNSIHLDFEEDGRGLEPTPSPLS